MSTVHDDEYGTSDLYFAAFLAARGVPLRDAIPGARCTFVFDASDQIDDLRFAWINGQDDNVSASRFAERVRQFKALAMRRT